MDHSPRHAKYIRWTVLSLAVLLFATNIVSAQPPRSGADEKSTLPSDQRLLKLHRSFILDAEKLAAEYERGKDLDKAKTVYGEILKLYPQHQLARGKILAIMEAEANADSQVLTVSGEAGWQDTGINVIKGKPVRIRATGIWTFRLSINLPPDGMKIPKELREFNLGSLIGAVGVPEDKELVPFAIGKDKSLIPKKSGRLFLRMYDISPNDNEGEIKVEVRGSFARVRR